MSIELIDITAREIIDLCKSEYYKQTGKTIQIGSDEYASSAVLAYVIQLFSSNINTIALNRYIDTSRGEYLDALAANYGITSRPDGYKATAKFRVLSANPYAAVIPAGEIVISDNSGNEFSNIYDQRLTAGNNDIVLFSTQSGSKYNGIPANEINTIVSGGGYILTATNTTQTNGGTDGFPYTDAGDDAFREWLKVEIQSFAGAGTYLAYEARAKNADSRVWDAYVLRQNDTGYQKGKVQIYIQTDYDTDPSNQVRTIVQNSCSDASFRPIGDLVQVSYATIEDFDLSNTIQVTYPERFRSVANSRNSQILDQYREYLIQKINRPFLFEEFCKLFTKTDDNGVYAIDAKPLNVMPSAFRKPKYPSIGAVLNLQNVTFENSFV